MKEYQEDWLMCPITQDAENEIEGSFCSKLNMLHDLIHLIASTRPSDVQKPTIRCPEAGSQYCNYKGFHSILLLALTYGC